MPVWTLFTGASGLNTKVDPARLQYNAKTGVQELAVAVNVDIDNTGRVSRRKGFTRKITGAFHSLWSDGNICLFVTGTSLCTLHSNLTTYTALAPVTAGARVSYCSVNGVVYWMNGHERGYIQYGTNHTWSKPSETYMPDTTRQYFDPPTGTIVAYYRGRVYIAQGDVLWYSSPLGFSIFELGRAYFQFDGSIVMLLPVENGIWVGTDPSGVSFLSGAAPEAFELIKCSSVVPVLGTGVSFHGRLTQDVTGTPIVQEDTRERAAMWLSSAGVNYGGGSGDFYNLSEDKLASIPTGITGAGLIHAGKYIGLIDP